MTKKIFLLLIAAIWGFRAIAQISSAEVKMMAVYSAESKSLPKDLLSSKTLVVISMLRDQESQLRGDWKSIATEAHRYINRLGIDAVQYIYIDDLNSGFDVKRSITNQMIRREIKNVFLLSQDTRQGQVRYTGVISAFNSRPTFVTANQPAWKSETGDLEILFRNLARAIDNADLVLENLLILDSPEYFRGSGITSGKRFETFNTDLRIDRLAVPVFENIPITDNSQAAFVRMIEDENKANLEKNSRLELIMANYPYQFQIVPYDYDEKKLITKGFQFVLMSVNTSGAEARQLLGYPFDNKVNELITMKKK
ncbi:MAG: hypothetical protein U5K79_06645 [Cyclobacteriaceae bacterium]|nr:hypothetical protein [Cyclobacteriaceae bacterium]